MNKKAPSYRWNKHVSRRERECTSDAVQLTGETGTLATQGMEEGNGLGDVGLWLDRELGHARERGKTVAGRGGEATS